MKLSYEELEVVEEMTLPDWAVRAIGVASLIVMAGGVAVST
jgi:hypothetical protein